MRILQFKNRFKSRAVILLYHRVARLNLDPQLLCVTPLHFAQHMECLQRYYQLISLRTLKLALKTGKIPYRSVVVTFDDGYADNLWNAKPLLERYNVPATVFVTSGYIGQNKEFPSDMLERCLLEPKVLPDSLSLSINGKTYSWKINKYQPHLVDWVDWNVTIKFYPTLRHQCYYELHRLLQPISQENREKALSTLANWALCPSAARAERRALNQDELKLLSNDGLVEIGAHTVNHLVLALQNVPVQRNEIINSKCSLENILEKQVNSFSYPYGREEDVRKEAIDFVKEAGFRLACANVSTSVSAQADLFWLPRFLVRDWSGVEFAKRLKRVFDG